MLVLAFDATAPRLTVGLAEDSKPLVCREVQAERGRGNTLDRLIDDVLGEAGCHRSDVEGLALVTGPGSLTACRMGWATATGWAASTGIPITGWPAHEVQRRHWMCPVDGGSCADKGGNRSEVRVFCLIHHRGDDFYAYDLSSEMPAGIPLVVRPGDWQPPEATSVLVVGPALINFRNRWRDALSDCIDMCSVHDAIVRGDRLAVWGSSALRQGKQFAPSETPLDYGLPPTFKKVS